MEQRAAWHNDSGIVGTDGMAAGGYRHVFPLFYACMYPGSNGCGAGFFRTGFWKGLLATALYFETVYFLDVLSGYLGQLATGDEDFVAVIQKVLNPERLFVMTVSRLLVLGAVLAAVHYKGIVRNIFVRYKLVVAVFVLLEHIGLLYCDQVFYSSVVKKRRIDIYFVFFPLLILFVLILTIVFILYMEKRMSWRISVSGTRWRRKAIRK